MTTERSAGAGSTADPSATAAVPPSNILLSQEINISNYMDYAQNFTYANSNLQSSIDMTPLLVNGQPVQTYDDQNGVMAEAFVTTGSGPQHVVIGYAGTGVNVPGTGFAALQTTTSFYSNPNSATGTSGDLFTGAQVYDEFSILAGRTPTGAVTSATDFANQVVADAANLGIGKSDVYVTGHNLGGTLAEYVASKTGLGGTSFGAAGIHSTGSTKAANFTNIVSNGDPIGNYATNGSNPLGPVVLSPNIKHYGNVKLVGPESDQATLRADAANAYSSHDFETGIAPLLESALTKNSLQSMASSLNVPYSEFGSFVTPAAPASANSQSASASAAAPSGGSTSTSGSTSSGQSGQTNTFAAMAPASTNAATPVVPSLTSTQINQYINICNYMYNARTVSFADSGIGKSPNQLGLTPLLQKNGNIVQVYNQKAGVFGEAFETTSTSNPQVIIAYQGTNPYGVGQTNEFSGSQLLDDASFFAGKPAPCAAASAKFAERVVNIAASHGITQNNVSLTGHSLGAAEAEYAAEATGLKGVTFGTPGIAITSSNLPPSQLVNFVNLGDPVGNLGNDVGSGVNTLGDFVTSSDINHYGTPVLIGPTPDNTLQDISNNFFSGDASSNSAYKLFGLAAFGLIGDEANGVTGDFSYHHLTSYADSLNNAGYSGIMVVCFCTGTAILTLSGERLVETLQAGDLVVTASGATRPIKWIGHRTLDCRRHPRASEMWPVRIAAHALGENRPARDLLVSPGHAICVDVAGEVLVPAGALVNGRTIVQEQVDRVTYWHVELESHDILLAENLPAESYLEMGNRGFFANAGVVDLAAGPDAPAAATHASFCRPYVDGGPLLDAIRARLDGEASAVTKRGEARAA